MGHLKECTARDCLSSGRNKSQNSHRSLDQADRVNSQIGPEGARAKGSTFAEDFMLEHSHAGLLIALMGSADNYVAAPKESYKSTQHYGFPS
jgi:hypothetical protein